MPDKSEIERIPSAGEMLTLAESLRAAASREGKPRGDHMVACHEMLAKHFLTPDEDEDPDEARERRDLGAVADSTAHALRAEVAMVTALTKAALAAAEALENIAKSHNLSSIQDQA